MRFRLHIPPSLYHRQFRLLWIGLSLSVIGSQMQFWGLLWHIRELTDQPIALGGIGIARIVPTIIFSLIGGAIADIRDRKRILYITQAVLTVIAFVLGLLTLTGKITLWHIYALTALQAVAVSFDLPARQSMLPNLLPARDLPNAFSVQSMAFQAGSILGPALTGITIASLGLTYVYWINAFSYVAIFAALVMMGTVTQQRDPRKVTRVNLESIKEGITFILGHPIIFSSMILDFFATFFSSANALMPIFARDILHVGEIGYGFLSSAQSIGAVSTALVLSQINEMKKQGPTLMIAVVFFGLATVLFGVSRSFPLTMLALVLIGATDTVSMVIRNTIRQLQTPDYIRGRMTSVNQIFFMGGPQLGEVEAGLVAQFFGAPIAVITGGIGCILAVGWIARRYPQLAHYSGEEAYAEAAT